MPQQSFDGLFDPAITRVVLERVDGELIVVDVQFDERATIRKEIVSRETAQSPFSLTRRGGT